MSGAQKLRNRVRGAGCPYCSHNAVLQGFNDLATVLPQVAKEWSPRNAPLKPTQVTPYANRKVWWKCEQGHEWVTLISTRAYGSKCPYCSGIKLLKGFNDLASLHPQLALNGHKKRHIIAGRISTSAPPKMSGGSAVPADMSIGR